MGTQEEIVGCRNPESPNSLSKANLIEIRRDGETGNLRLRKRRALAD